MNTTRNELREAASDLGWQRLPDTTSRTDVYRSEPYSIMVEFSRGQSILVQARLFTDAPDVRQDLPPRILAEVSKDDPNKRRRIRSWFYDYQRRAS